MTPKVLPPLGGQPLKTNDDGLVSLTDLFKAAQAAGWANGKQSPYEWSRRDGENFIAFVAENLNTAQCRIYKATKGKGGGTFAHWQIALAYAKYLSPELHMQVNEVYARFKTGDVTLAAEIADKAKPADAAWLAKRVQSTVARNQLTSSPARWQRTAWRARALPTAPTRSTKTSLAAKRARCAPSAACARAPTCAT